MAGPGFTAEARFADRKVLLRLIQDLQDLSVRRGRAYFVREAFSSRPEIPSRWANSCSTSVSEISR